HSSIACPSRQLLRASLLLRYNTARFLFFFILPPTTQIYTLSLHDALPISSGACSAPGSGDPPVSERVISETGSISISRSRIFTRSEEHTSELQSRENLVCRLLLEKKKDPNTPEIAAAPTTWREFLGQDVRA